MYSEDPPRHLVMERAPYDLLKFKIAEVKELQQVRHEIKFQFSAGKNIQQGL